MVDDDVDQRFGGGPVGGLGDGAAAELPEPVGSALGLCAGQVGLGGPVAVFGLGFVPIDRGFGSGEAAQDVFDDRPLSRPEPALQVPTTVEVPGDADVAPVVGFGLAFWVAPSAST